MRWFGPCSFLTIDPVAADFDQELAAIAAQSAELFGCHAPSSGSTNSTNGDELAEEGSANSVSEFNSSEDIRSFAFSSSHSGMVKRLGKEGISKVKLDDELTSATSRNTADDYHRRHNGEDDSKWRLANIKVLRRRPL